MFDIAGKTSEFFKETPGYPDGDIFLLHGQHRDFRQYAGKRWEYL